MYRSAEDLVREASEMYTELLESFSGVTLVDRVLPGQEDTTETVCDPTPAQIENAEALNERYARWVRIVAAYLERVQIGHSGLFAEQAEQLTSYFLFQRSGRNITHELWRALFFRESRQILAGLVQIVAENSDEFAVNSSTGVTFLDLDVRMTRARDEYVINVDSTLGSAAGTLVLPYDPRDVENFVLRHCSPRGAVRRAVPNSIAPFSKFGGALFDALMTGAVRDLYSMTRAHASANRLGIRFRLRQSNVPELMRIPWEFLFDGSGFICLEPRATLVRHLDMHLAAPALSVQLPLRILVTISSPPDLPSLDVKAEADRLRIALGPYIEMGLIDLTIARDGQLATVQRALTMGQRTGKQWHIWHFIGHGVFDERDRAGYLAFESSYGSRMVSGFEMATLFRDHDTLRLVVMNACETAASDDVDAMSGIAGAIVERGVPTVVAMQFPVSDDAAILFAGRFYSSISDGSSVDAAVTEARRAIFFQPNYGEWATPVVFTRSSATEVFNIVPSIDGRNEEKGS